MSAVSLAVITGVFSSELAGSNSGQFHQARWVTTASRTLRLFAGYARPPATQGHLAQYIEMVYVPCWFAIKRQSLAVHGSTTSSG